MDKSRAIHDAGVELLSIIKTMSRAEARDIQDFLMSIQRAFQNSLLDPNQVDRVEEFRARMRALIELTRIKGVKAKKELVMEAAMASFRTINVILAGQENEETSTISDTIVEQLSERQPGDAD